MSVPLPESLRIQQRPDSANTGLWYDKFCNTWNNGWSMDAPKKLQWIKTVTGKQCGSSELLAEYSKRIAMLADQRKGSTRVFSTLYRFVTGMGREHPVENGFAWHHALGVPYLPGSSIKGMLRSYLDIWSDTDKPEIKRIFGPRRWQDEEKQWHDTDSSAGSVIFLDAVPIAPVALKADIMTPHYTPYYQDGKAPGDWHSPTPIPFLTVGNDAKFLFAVLPRTSAEKDQKDCAAILACLGKALQLTGAGAKTAVGYGRFNPEKQQKNTNHATQTGEHPLFREINHAKAGELAQVIYKIELLTDPTIKKQAIGKILEKIKGKEFKKIRTKAEKNPDHWLNKIKLLS
ncbi:type III-B CRISPR module RAMP protein Cmr6 [uncultured Desulfobacter sp.]|uniref:type III-B CRISPR module RAMP protein Cmr6 n=1 Tax=uncultured Desulfobacter sp. TaxID=240139 RepID=UPI002AAC0247|nr:type III-B CRISPR module RAMP protein Cmr6 [uncultured Desulfobacter sp.]